MFHNMEYMYEVYKQRSFSKAAAKLYISQPALSAAIKKTEARIGQPIFDRSTNPIGLTLCGKEYMRTVEQIMELENSFERYLCDCDALKTGSLAVGASNFFASYILPPIVARFKKKYPGVVVQMIEADTINLERLLFSGELDMIIDNYDFDSGTYKRSFFYRENSILAVPSTLLKNKRLSGLSLTAEEINENKHLRPDVPAVPLRCFEGMPFLFLRIGNDTRIRFEKICSQENFAPDVVLELDQMATAYQVACQGLGIALVSDTLVQKVQPDDRILFFKLEGPFSERDIHFYYKNNKFVTRAMQAFLQMAVL